MIYLSTSTNRNWFEKGISLGIWVGVLIYSLMFLVSLLGPKYLPGLNKIWLVILSLFVAILVYRFFVSYIPKFIFKYKEHTLEEFLDDLENGRVTNYE